MSSILQQLADVVAQRNRERPGGSYVVELLDAGSSVLCAKVVEEAYELVEAVAAHPEGEHSVTHEAGDLLFHVLVLLEAAGVPWSSVEQELQLRFGKSGLKDSP